MDQDLAPWEIVDAVNIARLDCANSAITYTREQA